MMEKLKNLYNNKFREDRDVLFSMLKNPKTIVWGGFYNTYIAFDSVSQRFAVYKKDQSIESVILFTDEKALEKIVEAYDLYEINSQDLNCEKWVALAFHTSSIKEKMKIFNKENNE
jgi:hypothetical protein